MSTVSPPNFRRFGDVPVEELPKHIGQFSANSERIPLLNRMWYTGNMSNTLEILTVDRKNVNVLRKFCFIKKYAFLRELFMYQKCIISRWMTVVGGYIDGSSSLLLQDAGFILYAQWDPSWPMENSYDV